MLPLPRPDAVAFPPPGTALAHLPARTVAGGLFMAAGDEELTFRRPFFATGGDDKIIPPAPFT